VSLIAPGTPAPEFSLASEDGERFTQSDLKGHTTVLVFYPFAFSPVCTDQFQVYEEVIDEFQARGARLFGVSTDASYSQKAFRESLGVTIPQLSDFEPKGAGSRALGGCAGVLPLGDVGDHDADSDLVVADVKDRVVAHEPVACFSRRSRQRALDMKVEDRLARLEHLAVERLDLVR